MGFHVGTQLRERRLEKRWRWGFALSSIFSTVAGCVLIGASLTLYADGRYQEFFDEAQHPLVALLFLVSWLGALAGFLGVCIVAVRSYRIFYAMNILLGLVAVAKVAAVCFTLIYRVKSLHSVEQQLEGRMFNYSSNVQARWDLDQLQVSDECCGVRTPMDWANATLAVGWTNTDLPDSCCAEVVSGCGKGKADATVLQGLELAIHRTGCLDRLEVWIDGRMWLIGAVAGVTIVGEGIMVALSQKWIKFIELD